MTYVLLPDRLLALMPVRTDNRPTPTVTMMQPVCASH